MKVRQGFVSNSSSASFVVKACCLTKAQKAILDNHIDAVKALGEDYEYSDCIGEWSVSYYDHEDEYHCDTYIDNFRFWRFLEDLGIKCSEVDY
jgi:hypothetical protein